MPRLPFPERPSCLAEPWGSFQASLTHALHLLQDSSHGPRVPSRKSPVLEKGAPCQQSSGKVAPWPLEWCLLENRPHEP